MKSIWESAVTLDEREKLPGDRRVHTLVIGAGMAGILTAYFLQEKGIEVMVVEAGRIASGQTQNTTAKITSQHSMIYQKLLRKAGKRKAKEYALANEDAIRRYEELIQKENIECHFERLPAYLYSGCNTKKADLQKEAEVAVEFGIDAGFFEGEQIKELPFVVAGAVKFHNQAQFHPLEFIRCLAEKLTVYENTKVLSVTKHNVYTNRGDIYADNIVFACHYPIVNVPGFYFLRQHQERSYVLALKGPNKLEGMYYSIDKSGISLRSAGDKLLLGGGGHRTGIAIKKHNRSECNKNDSVCIREAQQKGYAYLRNVAKTCYPDAEETCAWSAQDCMPHDGIPFIGKYSIFRPYWYVATGFHKWGMTTAMIAAVTISNRIAGETSADVSEQKNRLRKSVFEPQRCMIRAGLVFWIKDVGESILGLTEGLLCKQEHRCSHMGCKLKWNKETSSWDCPCHGSRFSADGKLLDNPAKIDLTDERIS